MYMKMTFGISKVVYSTAIEDEEPTHMELYVNGEYVLPISIVSSNLFKFG